MREYIVWQLAGWYAPIQTGAHEDQAVGWYSIPGDFDREGYSDNGDRVWDVRQGLGTPRWFDSADEL